MEINYRLPVQYSEKWYILFLVKSFLLYWIYGECIKISTENSNGIFPF